MCGVTGILGDGARNSEFLARMTGRLEHRGPDDEGLWSDPEAGIAFGHRRLSIVDLSPAGHEPMHSASGRLTVTFNGEIYNHQAIRERLEGEGRTPPGGWRGYSDIETFLEAIDHWGLERALDAAVGMFAFGLWDHGKRTLRLVRDRFGEKPLYYGWVGGDILFASELKAMRAHPRFDNAIERRAVAAVASRMYVPAPLSIYRGIYKLEPGCILTLERGAPAEPPTSAPQAGEAGQSIRIDRYYDYRSVVRSGIADPYSSEAEAIEAVEAALGEAIKGQGMADVPVGAFLSGGIDSSLVTALYQAHNRTPVRTFSIGFEEAGYNEAADARRVAEHLGTVHHEQYVTGADAIAVIPQLPHIYDEPFADSSQIPTFLVSRFARGEVTVALTGDGGDEMFGGYNRHVMAPRLWSRIRSVPMPLRAAALRPMAGLSDGLWSQFGAFAGLGAKSGTKIRKVLHLASTAKGLDHVIDSFLDEWAMAASPVLGVDSRPPVPDLDVLGAGASDVDRLTCYDAISYLPDDILCKVDRASMAVSLETRVPFLDHRLAAVAARVPSRWKVHDGRGKQVLRHLLDRHVPRALVERPKAGFGIPLDEWLRGPLRDWAEDLLNPVRLRQDGLFDAALVQGRWDDVKAGRSGSGHAVWAIAMINAWLQTVDNAK